MTLHFLAGTGPARGSEVYSVGDNRCPFETAPRQRLAWVALVAAVLLAALPSTAAWAQPEGTSLEGTSAEGTAPEAVGGMAGGGRAGHMAKAASPSGAIIALAVAIVCGVLWILASVTKRSRAVRQGLGGVAMLAVVYAATSFVVWKYKKPGQMSVIEAQAMDMSAMKPPQGAVPVATEVAKRGPFRASVTYTGTVVAYTDEDIYPRVVGTIVDMPVYPGDTVKAGQVIARLDSVELSAREREALMGREAASEEQRAALAQATASGHAYEQALADLDESRSARKASETTLSSAQAAVTEADSAQARAEHDLTASQAEHRAAQSGSKVAKADLDAARSAVGTTQAELASAQADAAYWEAEIKRSKVLVDADAISLDEYQREEAKFKAARAAVDSAQAKVKQSQAAASAAEAAVAQADAGVEAAASRVDAMTSALAQAKARLKQAEAQARTAEANVEQANARVARAEAMAREKTDYVRAARASDEAARARIRQSAANAAAASTVRGYTVIRSTVGGRVIQRLVSPGVLVSPGMPILRVSQTDRVRLQAHVSETDLPYVNAGNSVHASPVEPSGRAIETRVTSVFPNVDPRARTAIVEAVTPNPAGDLYPGQSVAMEIETGFSPDAISVPNSAIVERVGKIEATQSENRPAVWVARTLTAAGPVTYYCTMHPEVTSDHPGPCPKCGMPLVPRTVGGSKTAHLTFVALGRTSGKRTEVLSGLKEGDEVIVRGHEYLREGETVVSTPWGEAGPIELPTLSQAGTGMDMGASPAPSAHGGHPH